jgi:hypothetical protein
MNTQDKYGVQATDVPTSPSKLGTSRVGNLWKKEKSGIVTPVSTLPPDCGESKTFLGSAIEIHFATLTLAAGAQADQLLQIPSNMKQIALVAMTSGTGTTPTNSSIYMHFFKLNKSYPGNQVLSQGNENWFPFTQVVATSAPVSGTSTLGTQWHFKKPLPNQLYFDVGDEAAVGARQLTFAVGNDIERVFFPSF